MVSRGGRTDLAGAAITRVQAPTLLIVGELDTPVMKWNEESLDRLPGIKHLARIAHATHLFAEPGALGRSLHHRGLVVRALPRNSIRKERNTMNATSIRRTFTNRVDAGRRWRKPEKFADVEDLVILALPRGGVPVAAEISTVIDKPFDVLIVRKLGVPGMRKSRWVPSPAVESACLARS